MSESNLGNIRILSDEDKKEVLIKLGFGTEIHADRGGIAINGVDFTIFLTWDVWDKIVYAVNKVKIAQGEKE